MNKWSKSIESFIIMVNRMKFLVQNFVLVIESMNPVTKSIIDKDKKAKLANKFFPKFKPFLYTEGKSAESSLNFNPKVADP